MASACRFGVVPRAAAMSAAPIRTTQPSAIDAEYATAPSIAGGGGGSGGGGGGAVSSTKDPVETFEDAGGGGANGLEELP